MKPASFGFWAILTAGIFALFSKGSRPMSQSSVPSTSPQSALDKRARVVALAASQVGVTDPRLYWLDAFGSWSEGLRKFAWCGVFALWCLRNAGLTSRHWISGLGFIWVDSAGKRSKSPYLPTTSTPAAGDIAYFDKPYQHYAIVEEVDGTTIHLIAGNTPNVSRSTTTRSKAVFYSIAPLVNPSQLVA
jgi:hypothetical protein